MLSEGAPIKSFVICTWWKLCEAPVCEYFYMHNVKFYTEYNSRVFYEETLVSIYLELPSNNAVNRYLLFTKYFYTSIDKQIERRYL